jgi:hypothetical protein
MPGPGCLSGTFKTMTGLLIVNARVSTNEQDPTAQKNALAALWASPDKTFTDQGLTGAHRARAQGSAGRLPGPEPSWP